MENFNYQLHRRNENDALEQLEFGCENNFINRSDFTSSDVERVLMEAQESILSNMEPIGSCQDTNSFLNPINDILGDICEFSKTFGATNVMPACSQQAQQVIPNAMNLNCSWPITEPPSCIGVSANAIPQDNITNDSGFFNITSGNDSQLLLPENTVEYPNPDCSFLGGDFATSFNQLFQGFDHQQLSFMSTPIAAITHPPTAGHSFSDAFLSTIGSLPASTTITPISVEERQIGHRNVSPAQQEVTIEACFVADRGTKRNQSESENFAPMCEQTPAIMPMHHFIPQQFEESTRPQNCVKRKSLFGVEALSQSGPIPPQQHKVIAVLNQNQCSQIVAPPVMSGSLPTQNVCLFPHKTQSPPAVNVSSSISKRLPVMPKNRFNWTAVFPRKHYIHPPEMIIMHPLRTRKLMTSRRSVPAGSAINLSEYFDTSSISIPMIRERPRSDSKNENRRKQKLNIIPGAENFIFEIQRNEEQGFGGTISAVSKDNSSLERELYPETELPELEEIFKRKKKTTLSTSSVKRANFAPTVVTTGPPQKKQCINNVSHPQPNIHESSASFEEKISLSIALRQGRSKIPVNRTDTTSESDSAESDEGMAQGVKSLKCLKCMKLFKSTRSLAIHTKRCTAMPRDTHLDTFIHSNISNDVPKNIDKHHDEMFLERRLTDNEGQEFSKTIKIDSSEEMKARPITRSQTRRSTGRLIRATTSHKRSK